MTHSASAVTVFLPRLARAPKQTAARKINTPAVDAAVTNPTSAISHPILKLHFINIFHTKKESYDDEKNNNEGMELDYSYDQMLQSCEYFLTVKFKIEN